MIANFRSASRSARTLAAGLVLISGCCFSIGCNNSPQAKEAKFLSRGEAFLGKKDFSRALLEFKNASSAVPKDAEPYYQTGLTFLAMGNLRNAVLALRTATNLNPNHHMAQLKLGELLAAVGDKELLQQAASELQAVLTASPENAEAGDALALAEWKLGKTEEAAARLEETLRKLPSRIQTSVELAHFKLTANDLDGAESVLRQAVASAPQSSPAELALGQLYMIRQQPHEAETAFQKAIQLDPHNGAAFLGLAALQVAAKRTDEAEETYRKLSAFPDAAYKPLHALFLFNHGKRDQALVEFQQLAKADPSDRRARSRLFAAYLALGKQQEARNLLAAALQKNPKDADALFERAGLFLGDGNGASAERDLKDMLRSRPDSAEAHIALSAVYRTQHLPARERDELNLALKVNPSLLRARLALARSFTLSNEAKTALEVLDNAPAAQKNTVGVAIERNWAFLALNDTKQLRSSLEQILRVKRFPDAVIQDAVLRLREHDYAGARADAEEAIRTDALDLRGARLLADTYLAQNQPAKAEERLKELVSAHPQSASLVTLLGKWYLENKRPADARKCFEAAHVAEPTYIAADLSLAQLDYQEKHFDVAQQRLLTIVSAQPRNLTALLLLASIAGDTNQRDEAIKRYRAVLEIDSTNALALNNLAYGLVDSDPDAALKYAQQAVELLPNNGSLADTLGWIYYRKAVYGTAVTYLETAVAKDPTPRHQFHLAMSYLKVGKEELGHKTLELALKQDPKLLATEKGW